MDYIRKEHELPLVTEKWGWKYHHLGIPVKDPVPGERYIPHLKLYVKGFELMGKVNSPMEGVKVAMIKHNGAPIELMEFDK